MRPDSRLSDDILRRALDAAPDGVAIVDEAGTVVAANQMATRLFEYSHDGFVGLPVDELLPESGRPEHAERRSEYAAHPRTPAMGSGLDLRARKRSGVEFPVEISLSPLETADGLLVVAIVRDITERRAAERELGHAHEQLALVDDRERIARDLHDTVVQRLFAVGLSLQGAIARAASDPAVERIQLAVDEIDLTIRDIRSSIFALHTRRHSAENIRDEVIVTAHEAARVLGFEPAVTIDGPIDTVVSNDIREHMLATLREALSNVTKHAHASSVEIDLFVDGHYLCLRVRDDGVGMADHGVGNGLNNMRDRAETHGGDCRMTTPDAGGTQIDWRVSLASDDD